MSGTGHLRAGDEERRRTADALQAALEEGRITLGEFDERSGAAWAAVTVGELRGLLDDLVPDAEAVVEARLPAERGAVGPAREAAVSGDGGGSGWAVGVLGGSERRGTWLCAPKTRAVGVLGGVDLDFTEARLESAETTVVAVAVLGGVDIAVPETWRLHVDDMALLGGVEVADDPGVTVRQRDVSEDAPVLRIQAVGVLGGVEITRVPVDGAGRSR